MYAVSMMGTKNLKPAIEAGVQSVKKADASLRLCIAIAAATLVVGLLTLVAVLASRPAHA
jgi:hypothetical protein